MAGAINGIDHCVILVRDLEVARERMSALGFTVTPRGVHSPHMGTANHCIMLRQAYFEVLSVINPTEFNARWREKLARREGLDAVPLRSDNVDTARASLVARGLDLPEPIDFSRPVDLPDGPSEAAFRLVMIPEAHTPHITMFAIQHFTPETVWYPDYLNHPNGASGVRGVTGVHDDPASVAPAYERIFGAAAVTTTDAKVRINTGAGEIIFLTPAGFAARFNDIAEDPAARAPYLAALSISVDDRTATASCLDDRNLSYSELRNGNLCVAPENACGTLIEFV